MGSEGFGVRSLRQTERLRDKLRRLHAGLVWAVLSLNPHPFKKRKGAAPKGRLEREGKRLEGPAAVDDVDGAGGVGGFVGGEVDGEGCDFFGLADATDGLAGDKVAAGFFNVAECCDALF